MLLTVVMVGTVRVIGKVQSVYQKSAILGLFLVLQIIIVTRIVAPVYQIPVLMQQLLTMVKEKIKTNKSIIIELQIPELS